MTISLVRNGRHLVKVGHERRHHVGKERLTERKARHSRLTGNELLILSTAHILPTHLGSVVEQLAVYHRYIVLASRLVTRQVSHLHIRHIVFPQGIDNSVKEHRLTVTTTTEKVTHLLHLDLLPVNKGTPHKLLQGILCVLHRNHIVQKLLPQRAACQRVIIDIDTYARFYHG